jgi:hypothetical protein
MAQSEIDEPRPICDSSFEESSIPRPDFTFHCYREPQCGGEADESQPAMTLESQYHRWSPFKTRAGFSTELMLKPDSGISRPAPIKKNQVHFTSVTFSKNYRQDNKSALVNLSQVLDSSSFLPR